VTQPPLFDVPEPPEAEPPPRRSRARRRAARCDDCHRPVWAPGSLRVGPDGKRRGDKCRRKAARLWRRWKPPRWVGGIRRMRPGDDQLSILSVLDPDQEPT
jgi:hypothetical protein